MAGVWAPGDIIESRYEVLRVARGGMAIVYIAYDRHWKATYAIKGLLPTMAGDAEAQARFHREASLWVKLGRHANIVTAELVTSLGGQPHIVLEYVAQGDMAQVLKAGPLSAEQAVIWALQYARGLQYAQEKLGIVHRDVKPSNALITAQGVVKVTDFGIARSMGAPLEVVDGNAPVPDVRVTETGAIMGTIPYMPPEAFRGGTVDSRSDIYAFGCMLFEMLTCQDVAPPGQTLRRMELIDIVRHRMRDIPVQGHPDLARCPGALVEVLQRCLRASPQDRYPAFADLVAALEQLAPESARGAPPVASAASYNNQGVSLSRIGAHEEALGFFRAALELEPQQRTVLQNGAESLIAVQRYDEARDVLEDLLRGDPTDARARGTLALCCERSLRWAEAVQHLWALIESDSVLALVAARHGEALLEGQNLEEWRRRHMPITHGRLPVDDTFGDWMAAPLSMRTPETGRAAFNCLSIRKGHISADGVVVEIRQGELTFYWPGLEAITVCRIREATMMDFHLTGARIVRLEADQATWPTWLPQNRPGGVVGNVAELIGHVLQHVPHLRVLPATGSPPSFPNQQAYEAWLIREKVGLLPSEPQSAAREVGVTVMPPRCTRCGASMSPDGFCVFCRTQHRIVEPVRAEERPAAPARAASGAAGRAVWIGIGVVLVGLILVGVTRIVLRTRADFRLGTGMGWLRQHRWDGAFLDIKAATDIDPTYDKAWMYLCLVDIIYYERTRRSDYLDAAEPAARQAVSLDKDDALAHLYLAAATGLRENWTVAGQELSMTLTLTSDHDVSTAARAMQASLGKPWQLSIADYVRPDPATASLPLPENH